MTTTASILASSSTLLTGVAQQQPAAAMLAMGAISPEEILILAERTIRGTDEQIRGLVSEMNAKTKLASVLGRIGRACQDTTTKQIDGEKKKVLSAEAKAELAAALDELASLGGEGAEYAHALERKLFQEKRDDAGNVELGWAMSREDLIGGNNHEVGSATAEEALNLVKQQVEDTNSGMEFRMARLNTQLSQRQQFMQMFSNMNSILNATTKSIVENMR